jgi:hypothetical protein
VLRAVVAANTDAPVVTKEPKGETLTVFLEALALAALAKNGFPRLFPLKFNF